MRFSAIVAVIGAFAVVLFTNHSEGDPVAALVNLEAAVIVLGGSFMAILGQFHMGGVLRGIKGLKWLVKPPSLDVPSVASHFVELASIGRKGGLLKLQEEFGRIDDPLFRFGLQLVVDGKLTPDAVRSQLHARMEVEAADNLVPAEVWESVGGFAPTLGVLGAVMGLIHVMLHLDGSGSGNNIGAGIAAAFVATLYGVGSANLIFIPAGKRLQRVFEEFEQQQEIIVLGLVSLAEGVNGPTMRDRLSIYVGEESNQKGKDEGEEAAEPQEAADAEG